MGRANPLDPSAVEPIAAAATRHKPATKTTVLDRGAALRRRALLRQGVRIYAAIAKTSTDYSLAMLDAEGMVISWYGGIADACATDDHVLGRHVSQFYIAEDIALGTPYRVLCTAAVNGSSRQQGWRRRSRGAVFWGNTVTCALLHADGRLQGFSHVTRTSNGPRESLRVARAASVLRGMTACWPIEIGVMGRQRSAAAA